MSRDLRRIYSQRILDLYSTGPTAEGISIRAAVTADQPSEMLIYDAIGSDGYGGGVSATMVVEALATIGNGPLVVRLNSPGGDVFDGLAIYNSLKDRPNTEFVVDGLAASAASVIAMAGPLTMATGSLLMIHNAWSIALGNKAAMNAKAGILAKVDSQLASIYAERTGLPVDEIVAMLDAETWMTADEAQTKGFLSTSTAASTDKVSSEAVAGITAKVEPQKNTNTSHSIEHMRLRLRLSLAS